MKLFNACSALAFTSTAIAATMLLPTSYAKLEAKDVFHVTPEQKAEIREKIQPAIDQYLKHLSTDKAAGDKVTKRDMLMERDLEVSQQCRDDLTNSTFVTEMNKDIFFEAGEIESPVWTSSLIAAFAFLSVAGITTPNGLCVKENVDKISCNAALFPFFVEELFGYLLSNNVSPVTALMFEIPTITCTEAGGQLVHASFSTDCFGSDSEDFNELAFFGIPQCVPESCKLKEAKDFWKDNIKRDLKELGIPLDECRVEFKVDSKLPKKGKGTKASKASKSKKSEKRRKLIRSSHA